MRMYTVSKPETRRTLERKSKREVVFWFNLAD